MSKRRSGLKNDQRAYNSYFATHTTIITTPKCSSYTTINITDIATQNVLDGFYSLNQSMDL